MRRPVSFRLLSLLAPCTCVLATVSLLPATGTTAFAADYYVSSIHADKNDSHAGTDPGAPWATFNKIKQEWGTLCHQMPQIDSDPT